MLFTTVIFAQSSIVVSGHECYTVGDTFQVIQTVDTIITEVSLGIPKWEVSIETPKPIVKKKNIFDRILEFIKKLINKNK